MFKKTMSKMFPRIKSNNRLGMGQKPGMKMRRKPGSGGSRRMGTPTIGNILTGRRNNKKKMY